MLKSLKIKNFRNISNFCIDDFEYKNHVLGNNWIWKTNFLYSIYVLFQNKLDFEYKNLVFNWEKEFFLEAIFSNLNIDYKITFHYDLPTNKKTIFLNGKKATKSILHNNLIYTSFFTPFSMNMFYLWPKYRRDFLDNTLFYTDIDYKNIYSKYEEILKNRNKILKNISDSKSKQDEIVFWDNLFLDYSEKIYQKRLEYINFINENIFLVSNYIHSNYLNIKFIYKTKVDLSNIKSSISDYNKTNFSRDILLWRTNIWPHLDDIDILINDIEIFNYLSRWETKIFILFLKFLEISFVKNKTWKQSIILIDDILSELDINHLFKIISIFNNTQLITSGIEQLSWFKNIYLT